MYLQNIYTTYHFINNKHFINKHITFQSIFIWCRFGKTLFSNSNPIFDEHSQMFTVFNILSDTVILKIRFSLEKHLFYILFKNVISKNNTYPLHNWKTLFHTSICSLFGRPFIIFISTP